MNPERDELAALTRRFERERKSRHEAEAIAEKVTGELYASKVELERLNLELGAANEVLQQLNQSMRDFVTVASHDLRGPLTSILGWALTLRKKWDSIKDEDRQESLAIIERNARHLGRMIEDLLTISRIESGALEAHAEVVKFQAAIESVMQGFAEHVAEVKLIAPAGLAVQVDPYHLDRILTNYVGNALKYGEPPVEIEAREEGGWVDIRVRDHGRGVPSDFVPRLFDRFARGGGSNTRNQTGTGLGLSIVQGLARANGGDTWYEPNKPRGSCFAVRLPRPAA